MQIKTVTILKSVPASEKDYFDDAMILVVERNENGTIGLILNRPYGSKLTDLEEFKQAPKIDLFEGGPMQQDRLYFIHRMKILMATGDNVNVDIAFGGDFPQALSLIKLGKENPNNIKIFVGYCGWDKGQLENEIVNGYWEIISLDNEMIFSDFYFG